MRMNVASRGTDLPRTPCDGLRPTNTLHGRSSQFMSAHAGEAACTAGGRGMAEPCSRSSVSVLHLGGEEDRPDTSAGAHLNSSSSDEPLIAFYAAAATSPRRLASRGSEPLRGEVIQPLAAWLPARLSVPRGGAGPASLPVCPGEARGLPCGGCPSGCLRSMVSARTRSVHHPPHPTPSSRTRSVHHSGPSAPPQTPPRFRTPPRHLADRAPELLAFPKRPVKPPFPTRPPAVPTVTQEPK